MMDHLYKKKLGTTHPQTIDTLKKLLTLRREIAARENQYYKNKAGNNSNYD